MYLEVETTAGQRRRSTGAPVIYAAGWPDDAEEMPPAVVRRRPGETLGPVTVSFASSPARR